MNRPKRWDQPFDPEMRFEQAEILMARPEFANIDESRFPAATPLFDILMNDCKVSEYDAGELVIREGDYGNSAFLLMSGKLRVVTNPDLPPDLLGRANIGKKSLFSILQQIWRRNKVPEMRKYNSDRQVTETERFNLVKAPGANRIFDFEKGKVKLKWGLNCFSRSKGQVLDLLRAAGFTTVEIMLAGNFAPSLQDDISGQHLFLVRKDVQIG